MTISTEDLLNSILKSLDRIDYVKPEDIPNIDLYMDQVTTLMDSKLKTAPGIRTATRSLRRQ